MEGFAKLEAFMNQLGKAASEDCRNICQQASANSLNSSKDWIHRFREILQKSCDCRLNADDQYGNGDQSFIFADFPSDIGFELRALWSEGGDFNPMHPGLADPPLSHFMVACFNGNVERVTEMITNTNGAALTKLLEKRESMLRFSPLLGVIAGARSAEARGSSGHLKTAEMLLKLGARVDCVDVAGYSVVHHCCTATYNSLTLRLCRLLVEHGANVNAKNRFDCVPLLEPVMAQKLEPVALLAELGADPSIPCKTRTGTLTAHQLCKFWMKGQEVFAQGSIRLQGKRVRLQGLAKAPELNGTKGICGEKSGAGRYSITLEDGRVVGVKPENLKVLKEYQNCTFCGAANASSLCRACKTTAYCGRDCQKAHWKVHKKVCSKPESTQPDSKADFSNQGGKVIHLASEPGVRIKSNLTGEVLPPEGNGVPPSLGKSFIAKIQLPMEQYFVAGPSSNVQQCMVYNQSRTYCVHIGPEHTQYHDIVKTIREKGVRLSEGGCGQKGYFKCKRTSEDFLLVNIEKVAPAQPW
ncbi:hypothetical protein CYMTET_15848 [Cymbomonas tetramitiformis]|uniref:MYND-type domain-containing protein n=1 Tax=Cymbomonas tetramitiformis TaxID=36881 RepID=A0AAE0GDE5_9CHLO|nr:hypothetical protein CYMTET_15848 [Cymbomonas tetramitiformis]|eukprot:gene3661-4596_t